MKNEQIKEYDVIIMGGGTSGAILGSLLAKKTNYKIAIFEENEFPRDKIGESFAHPIIPVLEECGVLQKVMDSDCWIKKYGGIYDWGDEFPETTFFDILNYKEDGVFRWSMHVNRAEFDKILLDHAKYCGSDVFEKSKILKFDKDMHTVTLDSGNIYKCKIFVDASGRTNNVIPTNKKSYLSEYKNLAVRGHFIGGKPAQSLEGEWNIFKKDNLSAVGSFAFEHGWCWYIPTPKFINNEWKTVYSIGIVSDPKLLKNLDVNLRDSNEFLEFVKQIPRLKELIKDAKPVSDDILVLSNYSMIQEKFCNLEEGWLMVGDSAYFVDPLFSSGVSFSGGMASTASLLIQATLDKENRITEEHINEMWYDYDEEWHKIAHSFALSIDQWYHAIAKSNPNSVFWKDRNTLTSDLGIKKETFHALVDSTINQDLLTLLTSGTFDEKDLDKEGRFIKKLSELDSSEPDSNDILVFEDSIFIKDGFTLDIPGFKASIPPMNIPAALKEGIAKYWTDPINNYDAVPSSIQQVMSCSRFTKPGLTRDKEIRFIDERVKGKELYKLLYKKPISYGELKEKINKEQITLLKNLILEGMVLVEKKPVLAV